jgi:single-stranded DNA-binding protein
MPRRVNKVTLVGNVGKDPILRPSRKPWKVGCIRAVLERYSRQEREGDRLGEFQDGETSRYGGLG